VFLYRFDVLIIKNKFLKIKNITSIYFQVKNILKKNYNHNNKRYLNHSGNQDPVCLLENSFFLKSGFLGKWIPEK
jgi:hypothetical protein